MFKGGEKRISCKRCQARKIKCSRTTPCRSCSVAGVKCEFRSDDWKRVPISQEYVTALESRLATLESLLSRIKTSTGPDRDAIIESIDVEDHLPTNTARTLSATTSFEDVSDFTSQGCWTLTAEGVPIFHRANSAYGTGLIRRLHSEPLPPNSWPFSNLTSIPGIVINECIELFFEWQQPYCGMVDRSTLQPYAGNATETVSGLRHAVCALGALMSHDPNIRDLAPSFAQAAENFLTNLFRCPDVAIAQTLLLCAVFESGRGNVSKAWLYSGMAFGMAEALGIHEDLLPHVSTGHSGTLTADLESRRRMSLTLAISDKMMSLFVGRAPLMNVVESDVDLRKLRQTYISPSLPEGAITYPLSGPPARQQKPECLPDSDSTGFGTLLLQKQAQLATIVGEIQCQTHLSMRRPSRHSETSIWTPYNKLNASLLGWYNSLPSELRWSRWTSNLVTLDPGLATMHILYHIARLALNRSLLATQACLASRRMNVAIQASDIRDDSVETIIGILRRFSVQHTMKNAPFIFVHGIIAAADATLTMAANRPQDRGLCLQEEDSVLPTLDTMLLEMSQSWSVAGDVRNGLRERSQQAQAAPPPGDERSFSTPSTSTGFSPANPDFHFVDSTTVAAAGGPFLPQDPSWYGAKQQLDLDLDILGSSDLHFDMSSVFQNDSGLADAYTL